MGTDVIRRRSRRAGVALLLLATLAPTLTGCSKSPEADTSSSTTRPLPACKPMPGPRYPNTQRTLSLSESGGTWCLHVGERVAVQLTAPVDHPGSLWTPAHSSDLSRLQPDGGDRITPPRGETTTFLQARKAGRVLLQATRGHRDWRAAVIITR